DLLVCIRFDERGGQWSGSFLPDFLGDAQVKVRNYVSGSLEMVRVEIQNADLSNDDKVIGASNGNSGTYLILLSDDDSGFMPYRIDNFSMESLRIYQHKCETAEAIVHSYTSYQYAWDEPSYPHRLIIEVPGERVLGSYYLDDVKEYPPICLAPSSEKPERRFFISVHAEGATKVLSFIDSHYHSLTDIKKIDFHGSEEERKLKQQTERIADFSERIIFRFPFIGASLINSSPQELIYACAKETKVILVQSSDKQKVSFQISSLQVDNQLPGAPYPILLSFDQDYAHGSSNLRNQDDAFWIQYEDEAPVACDKTHESNFSFAASKWRKESSFVSYEYINMRVAPLRVELEEQVLLHFLGFLGAVSSRFLGSYSNHLPSVVPIGAPWQQIHRLAKRQKKIYIEAFELAPVKLTVSFSSNPWLIRKGDLSEAESFFRFSGTVFQNPVQPGQGCEALRPHPGQPIATAIATPTTGDRRYCTATSSSPSVLLLPFSLWGASLLPLCGFPHHHLLHPTVVPLTLEPLSPCP
ncbi:hypothetical protein Taro_018428, partial [Colocasia esculenta]|nr:hypothetical protein [Colocasia esculenta]